MTTGQVIWRSSARRHDPPEARVIDTGGGALIGVSIRRAVHGIFRMAVLAVAGILLAACPAYAQTDAELDALYQRGEALYLAGRHAEALPIAEQYRGMTAARFGEEHARHGTALGYLGLVYQALNRPVEAEAHFKRAVALKEKALGPDNIDVADALLQLAEFYRLIARNLEAEPLYVRAFAIA